MMHGARTSSGLLLLGLAVVAAASACRESFPFQPVVVDPDTLVGRWSSGPSMPGPRMRHAAVVFEGDLVVAGGIVGPGAHTASVIRLRPGAHAWEEMAPLPYELAGLSLVVVGDTLFAVGGDGPRFLIPERALFAYDPATDTWHMREPIPDWRLDAEAVAIDGELWLTGGTMAYDTDHPPDIPGDTILQYTPGLDRWRYSLRVPHPRRDHESIVEDGKLYMFGGNAPGVASVYPSVDILDLESRAWSSVADSFATDRLAATYAAPFFHVVGGREQSDRHRALRLGDHAWQRFPRLPIRVEWPRLVHWQGGLWMIGGLQRTDNDQRVLLPSVWVLDDADLGRAR